MALRQEMMTLLQEESELEEIVQMVGMDALSPGDRLKMEAARSDVYKRQVKMRHSVCNF